MLYANAFGYNVRYAIIQGLLFNLKIKAREYLLLRDFEIFNFFVRQMCVQVKNTFSVNVES